MSRTLSPEQIETLLRHNGELDVFELIQRAQAAGELDDNADRTAIKRALDRLTSDEDGTVGIVRRGGLELYALRSARTAALQRERDLDRPLIDWLRDRNIEAIAANPPGGTRKGRWRFPDVFGATNPKRWSTNFKNIALETGASFRELSSYELKEEIASIADMREAFFECLGNSSWANRRYVVTANVGAHAREEFERLAPRFGMGLIELPVQRAANALTFHPDARLLRESPRFDLDLDEIDRLAAEWTPFKDWMEKLA